MTGLCRVCVDYNRGSSGSRSPSLQSCAKSPSGPQHLTNVQPSPRRRASRTDATLFITLARLSRTHSPSRVCYKAVAMPEPCKRDGVVLCMMCMRGLLCACGCNRIGLGLNSVPRLSSPNLRPLCGSRCWRGCRMAESPCGPRSSGALAHVCAPCDVSRVVVRRA